MEHKKWIGWVVAAVLVGAAVLGLIRFVSIDDLKACGETPTTGQCARADAIVVVSGGDTRARTKGAVELYKNGWADTLIVSGAAQDDDSPSNAAAMRQQAISEGVPPGAILIDEAARNTNQNAVGAAELAKVQEVRNIIVVTSPYHLARATLAFEREFAGVGTVRSHPSGFDNNWPSDWWLTQHGWWLVGSELVKTSFELVQGTVQNE